jgi:hypothetical protein
MNADIDGIRSGAAALSALLADRTLDDADIEHAAILLASCRRARMELEREARGEEVQASDRP